MLYFLPDSLSKVLQQSARINDIRLLVQTRLNDSKCIFDIIDLLLTDHISDVALTELTGENLTLYELINLSTFDYRYDSQIELENNRKSELNKFNNINLEIQLCKLILTSDLKDFQKNIKNAYIELIEKNQVSDLFYLNYYYLYKFHTLLNSDPDIDVLLLEISKLEDNEIFNGIIIRYLYDFYLKKEKNKNIGLRILKIVEIFDNDNNKFNYFKFKLIYSLYTDHNIDVLSPFLIEGFSNKQKMISSILYPNYHCYLDEFLENVKHVINLIPSELLSEKESFWWGHGDSNSGPID